MIYLSKKTRAALRNEIKYEILKDAGKIAQMIHYVTDRYIVAEDVTNYLDHFLVGLNLDELAYKDSTVVYGFGLLLIVDLDPVSHDIRVRYGVSPLLRDIRFKLKKRNNEQVQPE